MSEPLPPAFAFGPFRLDLHEQILLREGQPVALTPKAFELLLELVKNAGSLVRKEELLARVWAGTFVEEAVLSVNISAIRKALDDDRNGHAYIETVPRRGYRFIAVVRTIEDALPLGEAMPDERGLAPASRPEESATQTLPTVSPVPPAAGTGAWMAAVRERPRAAVLVACAALLALVIVGAARALHTATAVRSLAVLPLRSGSTDPQQQQFADAIAGVLASELGRIPALRVTSRQSTNQYRNSDKPLPEIARELKVDYVAEGSVARDGDRVRITAHLIHAPSDRQVWARSYERDLVGTFAVQREVAESIAREIGVAVGGSAHRSDRAVPAEAYEAYLRGSYLVSNGESTAAIAEFEKATTLAPDLTAAYAGLASVYFDQAYFGQTRPSEAFPKMRQAALKATESDAYSAEAHAALAEVKLHYDWDWPGADREFRRSIDLNPSNAFVRHLYAHYKLTIGRPGDSLDEMDRAFDIDPVGLATAT